MISIYCQACKCQNQVFCHTLHTFKVSEVCNTGKSMAFWFQKGDSPNNKGKIMKTGGFLLQKKLKSHLMYNPPPIFVGNFRTCWKLQQYLFQVWLHEVCEGAFMIFLFAFMCVYIYIYALSMNLHSKVFFHRWKCNRMSFWCLLVFLAPNYSGKT